MSNLSKRVQKADKLTFSDIPGLGTSTGGTWGSKNDYYQVSLFQKSEWEQLEIADKTIDYATITTSCKCLDITNGELDPMVNCKGNLHTVCYHSIGYLKTKLTERNKIIAYCEDVLAALNALNFGGQLTKVISKQGNGFVWTVVRDKYPDVIKEPVTKILMAEENIKLMRGDEDDEGID